MESRVAETDGARGAGQGSSGFGLGSRRDGDRWRGNRRLDAGACVGGLLAGRWAVGGVEGLGKREAAAGEMGERKLFP